jgi:hypothetical protein
LGGQGEHVAPEPGVHHAAPHGDQDQEEGPERFCEQAAPLELGVREVEAALVELPTIP